MFDVRRTTSDVDSGIGAKGPISRDNADHWSSDVTDKATHSPVCERYIP